MFLTNETTNNMKYSSTEVLTNLWKHDKGTKAKINEKKNFETKNRIFLSDQKIIKLLE